jgi:hypothetical protein
MEVAGAMALEGLLMAINGVDLTKGELRKLNALRKSIGNALAEETFKKWLKHKASVGEYHEKSDPVAELLLETLDPLFKKKKKLNLGRYGYSIRRARGKGAKGLVVARIEGP